METSNGSSLLRFLALKTCLLVSKVNSGMQTTASNDRRDWCFHSLEVSGSIEHPAQAVRFRVYAYLRDGTILGEITSGSMYTITWSVHVANHKGSYNEYSGMSQPFT
jgi:hypothetical protein